MEIEIGEALPHDAAALTEIAFAAKQHWRYPESWIEQWRSLLTITPEYLMRHPCLVAKTGAEPVGFVGLREMESEYWIDHLWVLPGAMGRGIGRSLVSRAIDEAGRRGFRRLLAESDPNAEGFYVRLGARTIERRPVSVGGVERFLPIMEIGTG